MEIKPVDGSDYIELICDTNDFDSNNKLIFATTASIELSFIPKFVGLTFSKLIIGDEEFDLDELFNQYQIDGNPIILNCEYEKPLEIQIQDKSKMGYFWLMFTNITY